MQQPSAPIPISLDLPQFTALAEIALDVVRAYTSWRDPKSGEDVFAYFASTTHTGDEHNLRATLIRDRILPVFHYKPEQIEYESQERFDLTLWTQQAHERRRIAIIETKGSSKRNLAASQKGRETPIEQLQRYLTQAGLYLGVLTNGDEWHLFDFAVGSEPLASFSLLDVAQVLRDVSTKEEAERRLAKMPLLQQALAITFYYLDAQRWQQVNVFREHIANSAYHRIASLKNAHNVELLVQHIKQVLGSLRSTIHAQFALLQERYEVFQHLCTHNSAKDARPFAASLQTAIEQVVQFSTTFRLSNNEQLHKQMHDLLEELAEQYLFNGNISVFEEEYLQKAEALLNPYQISQPSLLEKQVKKTVHSLPPTQGLETLKTLLQIHYTYVQELSEEYALSIKALEAYQEWKGQVRGVFSNPVDEFCLQTAYISFVRLFFVRVCEDHGLIPRRISDGPFMRFEQYRLELLSGIKDVYLRLLEETYQRAQVVYHNFFGRHELFDWFTLDEYTILALFDLLNRYDFEGMSADVLGRVYNEGYIENKERSEKGQFYTPPHIVDYMLDAIGMPPRDEADEIKARAFLEKTVGDLSCGSGTFLVAAAARKSAILQRLVATGEVHPDYALDILTDTFLGLDLNPFACYLAEINLLIQSLPLLLDDKGQLCRSVNRFHIYCTDALEPTIAEQVAAIQSGKGTDRLSFPNRPRQRGEVMSNEERSIIRIKETRSIPHELTEFGTEKPGFDFLLGNPPYVSAGESADNLLYRNSVQSFGIYSLLHQRWDLFVPFFERNLQFLRPETGRLGLIVSNGIETEGYAERLRQLLSNQYRLLEIDFFPGLRLFQDAAVENTVVLLENRPPDEEHEVIRRRHTRPDATHFESLPPVPQLAANGQIFRWRYDSLLDKSVAQGSIPLCAIVYVGTGMEAQSKETFDSIVAGRRQKIFTLDNVFLSPKHTERPAEYTDNGVLGDDVDRYYLRRIRYVAYEKYLPQMRRPRHRALFQTPEKLLLGETSGGYFDREGLFANHSVQVVVSWKALEQAGALEERGIQAVLRESRQIARATNGLASIAELFDLRYLLGIINSHFIRRYIASNRLEGTREGRIYPDVWKRLPIKVASAERQQQVAQKVEAIQAQYRQMLALPTPTTLLEDPEMRLRDTQGYLAQAILRYRGDVHTTIGAKPTLRNDRLTLRRQPLAYLESTDPALLRYLELYLTEISPNYEGSSWYNARRHIQVPATLEAVHAFMADVDASAAQAKHIRAIINTISKEIEILIKAIYQEAPDAQMMDIIAGKRIEEAGGSLF